MPASESVRLAYAQMEGIVRNVGEVVTSTLRTYCATNNYLFNGRVKTLESVSEKLESGRLSSWTDLDDLFACTIIVPTSSHEPGVIRKLDACFNQIALRSRDTAKKAPDVFRFDATRYYARLHPDVSGLGQPGLDQTTFEVQIHTAFEYAWTRVTHDLVYKSDSIDWRRLRLASQLKASVEQIESTIGAFEQTAAVVQQSSWPEVETKTRIIDFFRELVADGIVPSLIAPASWRRFADNVYGLVASYSRNNHAIPGNVANLLQELSIRLRGPGAREVPLSGTLFQLVLGHVADEDSSGHLEKFTVVDSSELASMYDLPSAPVSFSFDLPTISSAE